MEEEKMEKTKETTVTEEKKNLWLSRETIIIGIVGIVVGLLIMFLIMYPKGNVVTINGKSISKEDYYQTMKDYYSIELLLFNKVDKLLLDDLYTLTDKEMEDVRKEADYWVDYYQAGGYQEQEFYEANGCANKDEFIDLVAANYKAQKYYHEYLEGTLEEGAVEKYYEENKDTVNKFDSKHILVQTSDEVTDEQALALANEIIAKLNEGKSFDEVKEEYKDQITYEELGFTNSSSGLEEAYSTALAGLTDGTYTTAPVKTSYGYHIIYRIATSTLDDIRNDIIDTLTEDLQSSDSNLYYKAFIELRKEHNIKFHDSDLEKAYDEYCKQYVTE